MTAPGAAARMPATTGTTRAISSSTGTSGTPVRPDWPPTSITVAPSATRAAASATRSSTVPVVPASENESGDALTMPIRTGAPRSTARPRTTRPGAPVTPERGAATPGRLVETVSRLGDQRRQRRQLAERRDERVAVGPHEHGRLGG